MKSLTIKSFAFADFEFDAGKRLLLKAGKPVALNSKTFDLLEVFIERRGEIVGKDELLERIWAGQFVEESNLTVHVSTLRKILGEARGENRFIVTVPGKDYKFVGEENADPGEITVENHSFSRIVINEEIAETEIKRTITSFSRKKSTRRRENKIALNGSRKIVWRLV